jgi:hypothetical protein
MDRQTVEDKDRDVVKKFRSVVEGKELLKKRKKGRLKLISGVMIVCGALLMVFLDQYSRQKPQPVVDPETIIKDSLKDGNPAADISKSEQGKRKYEASRADLSQPHENLQADFPLKIKSPRYLKNKLEIQNADIVLADSMKISTKSSQKKSITDGVKIAKILACQDVAERQHVLSQEEFSVKRDGKVYVWMNVLSEQVPHKLRHIYFINGRQYRTIPLSIKYPQMRTWSGISLNGSQDVGKWRVDVVSEQGQTLSHIEFKVVP